MSAIAHDQLEKSLRAALRRETPTLKSLSMAQALASFVQHWRTTAVNDLGDAPDDGLVVNFDLLRDRRTNFVMTLCRVVAAAADADALGRSGWRPASQLTLQIGANPDLSIFQLSPVVATLDCWDKANALAFEQQVAGSPQFQALAQLPVSVAVVRSSDCQCPVLHMNHPVNGFSWATFR
jgi:hypothetical protein